MKRREFMALIGGLAIVWSLASYAQQPKRVGVLGFHFVGAAGV
jgi:hypothetical protein